MARILSIEDDQDIQHLMGEVLFQEGYDVHYAWNGREGYEKILELFPDLILLDLMLPIMSGVDLLKKLKDNKSLQDIPIIIVTAYGDEAYMLKRSVEVLGAAAYLRKPVQLQELVRVVKQVLLQYPRLIRQSALSESQELRKGCVRADPKFMTVWVNDRLIATVTSKEFALLRCLIESPGPITKEKLLHDLGYQSDQGDALKQTIHRLRESFAPSEIRRIKTTSLGYELVG